MEEDYSILNGLYNFLNPQLKEIVQAFSKPEDLDKYFIEIPDANYIDLTMHDIASLVARSSNVYSRVARFAGIGRAQKKLLEGKYKRVYKANRFGKNEAEREASAILAAQKEYDALIAVEAVVELAESMESAARVSSESARKLMDKMQSMQVANSREEKGYYSEKDYSPF